MGWPIVIVACVLIGAVVAGRWWMSKAGPDVTQAQLQERMKNPDFLLIDVRSPGEYASGHVPGARNIPVSDISSHLNELQSDKDKDLIIYCQHGPRARMAQRALVNAGFSNVFHLEGDMSAWRSRGLPVETP